MRKIFITFFSDTSLKKACVRWSHFQWKDTGDVHEKKKASEKTRIGIEIAATPVRSGEMVNYSIWRLLWKYCKPWKVYINGKWSLEKTWRSGEWDEEEVQPPGSISNGT